jgi:hypothetical protein
LPIFFALRLNRQADESKTAADQKALYIHQVQQLYSNFDIIAASTSLSQLYGDLERTPTDTRLSLLSVRSITLYFCKQKTPLFLMLSKLSEPISQNPF